MIDKFIEGEFTIWAYIIDNLSLVKMQFCMMDMATAMVWPCYDVLNRT